MFILNFFLKFYEVLIFHRYYQLVQVKPNIQSTFIYSFILPKLIFYILINTVMNAWSKYYR